MRRFLVISALVASATTGLNGQEPATRTNPFELIPPTALETVLSKTGGLIVADFYSLGWVTVGDRAGRMSIDAVVVTEPGREERRTRGLRIDVTATGRVVVPARTYLDMEEVEGLSRALPYMIQFAARWKDTEKQEYTEVQFATKGDFRLGFSQDKRDQRGFVSSGPVGVMRVLIDMSEFARIKLLLDQAVTLLQGK